MRCGYCKQEGHNRRSCAALAASEGVCGCPIVTGDSVRLFRGVGTIEGCECKSSR